MKSWMVPIVLQIRRQFENERCAPEFKSRKIKWNLSSFVFPEKWGNQVCKLQNPATMCFDGNEGPPSAAWFAAFSRLLRVRVKYEWARKASASAAIHSSSSSLRSLQLGSKNLMFVSSCNVPSLCFSSSLLKRRRAWSLPVKRSLSSLPAPRGREAERRTRR